ncbi:hypothetical protein A4H97_25460 [Niastella yeongjuensis]|uniref:Uncharacterized protein n=1 Tax=Niastella yeongjuensis TaxID=354355 RepID=A0A1V9F0U8_9BACT|nr:hypothetical protein [Niastella yeongjuensis]OQP51970.1 hypothetical protein A4H97_25460 [Niastella yeongjuensis]SEP35889.1 hypothetical protein SAMN05660816_05436 [Niastella yeongjuensis]
MLLVGLVFDIVADMHHTYQQLDLQTLIDLLAEETEKYTKAFIIGGLKESSQQRDIINALVEEINIRKREIIAVKADQDGSRMANDFPCC